MTMMELKGLRGLKGLDALLIESHSKELISKEKIFHLDVNLIIPGRYQPRTKCDDDALRELASSIQAQGILLPLIVRAINDKYEIIAGERRWRAAKMIGLKAVPVIIRDISDETALAFALIENIQRESLNPIDEAYAFHRLKENFSMTHEEIAERVGRSRSSVTNLIRLLGLQEKVKDLLKTRKIEMGHARALVSLPEEQQLILANKIVKNKLSVREAEKWAQRYQENDSQVLSQTYYPQINWWEAKLSTLLSSKVKISLNTSGQGKVLIAIHSPDEIDWLISALENITKRD